MFEIPDDPAHMEAVFKEMKENLKSRATHPLAYRKTAIKKLLDGY